MFKAGVVPARFIDSSAVAKQKDQRMSESGLVLYKGLTKGDRASMEVRMLKGCSLSRAQVMELTCIVRPIKNAATAQTSVLICMTPRALWPWGAHQHRCAW